MRVRKKISSSNDKDRRKAREDKRVDSREVTKNKRANGDVYPTVHKPQLEKKQKRRDGDVCTLDGDEVNHQCVR